MISDLHTNLAYNSAGDDSDNCISDAGGQSAPLAQFGCDPSSTLVDYMLTRFTESFGTVDVLVVTGDHVAHDIAPDLGNASLTDENNVKGNLQATSDMVRKHFPDTLVLTTIGNNDGYHSQAIDEASKPQYYQYLYDLWMTEYNGNSMILN